MKTRRDARLMVMVTQEERSQLEAFVEREGGTISTVSRMLLLEALQARESREQNGTGVRLPPEMRKSMEEELVRLEALIAEAERRGFVPEDAA